MIAPERYVPTADICDAVRGHETDLLDALGIDWRSGRPHISCPYQDHPDSNPSWRWDERKRNAFCTCGSRDVLGVVMGVEGIGLSAAKVRVAELLGRTDLLRTQTHKGKGGRGSYTPRTTAQRCNNRRLPARRLR